MSAIIEITTIDMITKRFIILLILSSNRRTVYSYPMLTYYRKYPTEFRTGCFLLKIDLPNRAGLIHLFYLNANLLRFLFFPVCNITYFYVYVAPLLSVEWTYHVQKNYPTYVITFVHLINYRLFYLRSAFSFVYLMHIESFLDEVLPQTRFFFPLLQSRPLVQLVLTIYINVYNLQVDQDRKSVV